MRIVLMRTLLWVFLLAATAAQAAPALSYRIVATRPHDPTAFTEGFAIDRGRLFESTGRAGQSLVVIRDLATLKVLKSQKLDDHDFGEGLAVVGRQIVQLTWMGGVGYVYDLNLRNTGSFRITSEGWGLTYDGKQLIRSDGSSTLQLLDPRTFMPTGRIPVRDGTMPIDRINELEYVKGRVYANIWLTDRIAVIDPVTGLVMGWLDLSPLKDMFPKPADWNEGDNVLNGIAYDKSSGHFFVTGKCWPKMFEIVITGVR